MDSCTCSLFEGHFHKGVAVLINSLYNKGFRGNFYAGYKGPLPKWAEDAVINPNLNWLNARTLEVATGLDVHFLPINTSFHFAHYKPTFMIKLFEGPAKESKFLTYFDPDIVNLCNWEFYEQWMSFGVAMVHEIVSNDMPATHPSRIQWKKVINFLKMKQQREINSYINAGFVGVSVYNIEFLHVWSKVVKAAIEEYKMDPSIFIAYDRTATFYSIDQDAFNIAAMCCESPISEMGPEAMDFEGAGWTMSHATGWPKPWNNIFTFSALKGCPPSRPHKHFWNNTLSPIKLFPHNTIALKKTDILIATIIGRFYHRS